MNTYKNQTNIHKLANVQSGNAISAQQHSEHAAELSVVNGTLGIAIAAGILQNSAMTIPSAIYSILMFPGALLMIYLGTKKAIMDIK